MSTISQAPLDVVQRFMMFMETLNYDRGLTLATEDCTYTNPPPLGTAHGPDGIRAVFEPSFSPTREDEARILRSAVSGSVVFPERLDRHLFGDKWVEMPLTGVHAVRDGKIAYWRDWFDAQTFLSQVPTT